jgi:dipeptidyl aminopeptidase/acylaminoacyl peptidase
LDRASPIWWTSSDDPPFLIVHGELDTVVLPAQATRLRDYFNGVGTNVTLQIVTNGSHGFGDSGGTASPTKAQLTQQIADFLDAHVRLSPPPLMAGSGS